MLYTFNILLRLFYFQTLLAMTYRDLLLAMIQSAATPFYFQTLLAMTYSVLFAMNKNIHIPPPRKFIPTPAHFTP